MQLVWTKHSASNFDRNLSLKSLKLVLKSVLNVVHVIFEKKTLKAFSKVYVPLSLQFLLVSRFVELKKKIRSIVSIYLAYT